MAGLTKEQKAFKALIARAIELSGVTADEFEKLSADEQAAFKAKAQAEADAAAAEAKRIADEQAAFKAPDVDNSHLITVAKAGEEPEVHPSCLADHKRLGWKEA